MKINFSTLPNKAPEYDLMDLLEAGCHFGHQKAKRHPKMNEYIYAEKDGIHIFDLAKTAEQLKLAYNFVYDQAAKGNTMVMVGTKKQARELIETAAKESGAHFITARWLGGFLTNWTQVKRSLRRMLDIENGLKSGKFDGYTKFEKVQLEKERLKLARFFDGLTELKQSPDFLFVVDINREKNAIKEAQNMGVPVVAIVDTNSNPDGIDIVIPANDDAVRSLDFLISEISKAYQEGKRAAGKPGKTSSSVSGSTPGKAASAPAVTPKPVVIPVAPKVVEKEEAPVVPKEAVEPAQAKPTPAQKGSKKIVKSNKKTTKETTGSGEKPVKTQQTKATKTK